MRFSNDDLEEALADARAQHEKLAEVSEELRQLTSTATSKDRVYSATVDASGVLTDLTISGQAWRDQAPKEVASKIVNTVAQAQRELRELSESLLAPHTPSGVDAQQMWSPGLDLDGMFESMLPFFDAGPRADGTRTDGPRTTGAGDA